MASTPSSAGRSGSLLNATDFFGKDDGGGVEKFKTVAFRALHEQKLEEELQQTKQENERLREDHARVARELKELQISFEANIDDRERVLAFKSKRIDELNNKLRDCEAINASLMQTINSNGSGAVPIAVPASDGTEVSAPQRSNSSKDAGGTVAEVRSKMMALLNAGKPLFHALDTCKEQEYKHLYEEIRVRYEELQEKAQQNDAVMRETQLAQAEKQDSDARIKQLEAQLAAIALEKDELVHRMERKLLVENDRLRREKEVELQNCEDAMRTQMRMQLDVTTQRTVEENERVQLELRYQSSQLEKLLKQVDHLRAENKRAQQEMHVFEDMNAGLSKKLRFYEQLFAKMQHKDEQRAKNQSDSNQQTGGLPLSVHTARRGPRKPPLPSLISSGPASGFVDSPAPPSCFDRRDNFLQSLDDSPEAQDQLNMATDLLEEHLQNREFTKKQVTAALRYHQGQYHRRQMSKNARDPLRPAPITPILTKKKLMLSKACYSPASYPRRKIREPPMTLDALIRQKASTPTPPQTSQSDSSEQPPDDDDAFHQRQILHSLLPELTSPRKTSRSSNTPNQPLPLTAVDASSMWKRGISVTRRLDEDEVLASPPATARF